MATNSSSVALGTGTGGTTVYTASAAEWLLMCRVANIDGATADTVYLWIDRSATVIPLCGKATAVGAGYALELIDGKPFPLQNGDIIKAYAGSSATTLKVTYATTT